MNENERQQQEYEFVMEGITTRMLTAFDKMHAALKYVCVLSISIVLIVVLGFIIFTQMWIGHVNHVRDSVRNEVVTDAGTESDASLSQFGP